MKSLEELLQEKLDQRKEIGLYRTLPGNEGNLYDFASNDYLGLAVRQLVDEPVFDGGSTGSRLLTGDSRFYHELETFLADHFEGESSLVFNSGYQANLSILSALPQRGDTVIFDELSHACIKDGVRLSLAKHFSFKHNNPADLDNKLSRAKGNVFVVVEGVYSMDGDTPDTGKILDICAKYKAHLIIDEAHSGGVFGEQGKGISYAYNNHPALLARIYTFGKAWGAHGACFVGSDIVKDYLINYARPFIYTTALPAHSILRIRKAISFQSNTPELSNALHDNIEYFKKSAKKKSISLLDSNSAIQPVLYPGNKRVKALSEKLRFYGFDVRPILSPTVPKGTERLRVCLHNYNEKEHIDQLVRLLEELC